MMILRTMVVSVLVIIILIEAAMDSAVQAQAAYAFARPLIAFYQTWKPFVDEFINQVKPDASAGFSKAGKSLKNNLIEIDALLNDIKPDGMIFPTEIYKFTTAGCFIEAESVAMQGDMRRAKSEIEKTRSYLEKYGSDLKNVSSRLNAIFRECQNGGVYAVAYPLCDEVFYTMEYEVDERIKRIASKEALLKKWQNPLERQLQRMEQCRPEDELDKLKSERLRGAGTGGSREAMQQRLRTGKAAVREADLNVRRALQQAAEANRRGALNVQQIQQGATLPVPAGGQASGCNRAQIAAYDQWLAEAEAVVRHNAQFGVGQVVSSQQEMINATRARRNAMQAQCR